jgi:hypothetical protein
MLHLEDSFYHLIYVACHLMHNVGKS